MSPPDENQTASTRRPFMSAGRRPAPSEDNILARLERDARRGRPGMRWKQSWIAWCSLASLAIIGLIGVLASLARENIELHSPMAAAESKTAPDPYATRAPAFNSGFAPLPQVAVEPKQPAAVIDMRAERTMIKSDNSTRPPLVMLKPDAAHAKDAAVAPAPRVAVAKPAASKAVAAKPAAVAPHKTAVAAAARPKKPAPAPAAAPEPPVDSDVALLSAIILHASRHAGERAQLEAARCGAGKKCAPAPDPLTSMKATD